MTNTNQAMGVKVSSEGIKKIKQRMAELVRPDNQEKRGWTQPNLADRSGVDLSTVKRCLKGNPIRPDFLSYIAEAVGLDAEDLIERPLPDLQESALDWLVISGEALDKQRDANQLRRQATGLGAENNVYMPLDLVETREKKQKPTANNQDKSGNKRETEEVIYPHAQFLENLPNWHRKNKHIAIAGEAGAGKTTFLVTIAEKLKNIQHLPIFIGLADLQGRSLKTYINDVWLPYALNERQATEEQKDALFQQFQTGKIWLLLDALDEMQAKSSVEALDKIKLEEIIGQSRVVMTCRLNVWDAYINKVANFDTFRMGNLSLEQIDSFISQWFSFTECPENAAILQVKLKEASRDRIRDMVTHPLRLALLCQAFYRNPNTDLPETKAGLYELFVRYFYEWKPNIVDVDLRTQDSLRESLHQALGKLAIASIDGDAGFRLSRSFAVKAMGNSDLFNTACKVGWLNLIERNERDEEVYSFFHATFQEYFAALAINDWDFFLPRKHIDKPLPEQKYRIFEPQWRYCFLLWIGRENGVIEDSKEEVIKSLWQFNDSCYRIYSRKAKCLAVAATGEFSGCDENLLQLMIKKTLKAGFTRFIRSTAKADLLEANLMRVLEAFLSLIDEGQISKNEEKDIIDYFKQKWKQNKQALDLLNASGIKLVKSQIELELEYHEWLDGKTIEKKFNDQHKEYYEYLDQEYKEINILINDAKDEESLINLYKSDPNHFFSAHILKKLVFDYPKSKLSIDFILSILFGTNKHNSEAFWSEESLGHVLNILISNVENESKSLPEMLSLAIITNLGQCLETDKDIRVDDGIFDTLLWNCSENTTYAKFYEALHQPLPIHPEVVDFIPACDVNIFHKLEGQFIDFDRIKIELDAFNEYYEIRCLVIDIRHLDQESEITLISQKIANRIFDSLGMEIPVIQNITILEAVLLNLKRKIGTNKLAIALLGAGDNQAITQLCHELAIPSVEFRLFREEQSTEQVVTQIRAWLSEI
jgi:transcriptional regulator with XRE-family HTH domain